MALHLGAATYLIGNQISDSFSPSTAFLFWAVYLAGCRSALPRVARIASDNVERPDLFANNATHIVRLRATGS